MTDEDIHWNSETSLPPVDCPLLILLYDVPVCAKRESYVASRENYLTYKLADETEIKGRFKWTYP